MFGFARGLGQNSSFGFSSRPIFPLVLRVPLLVPNDLEPETGKQIWHSNQKTETFSRTADNPFSVTL